MGCSASKHQIGTEEKRATLTRSFSVPRANIKEEPGSPSSVPWKPVNKSTFCRGACKSRDTGSQKTDFSTIQDRSPPMVSHRENLPPRDGPQNGGRFLWMENRSSSFRVRDANDRFSGLRLLLSPAATPSRTFASSTRSGTLSKNLSSSTSLALNQSESPMPTNPTSASVFKALPPQLEGMGDSEEISDSPLFDPSILATFERAVETVSDDSWQESDTTSSSSSRVGCSSSDTCSDADSLDYGRVHGLNGRAQQQLPKRVGSEIRSCNEVSDEIRCKSTGLFRKKHSSKVAPLLSDSWITQDNLERFEIKCPPGCENKIVLYFTSLRGIRKTYEDCRAVRLILKGFGVQVDERDVWMHSSFRKELTNLLGAVLTVPRLFIKGRYIGGVDDVKHLHDQGVLGNLLEGLPAASGMCDVCDGVRFIPCISCSGSRKLVLYSEVLRCPDCNENGLMMCPFCNR
ncbi:hypothetical protein KP509_38G044900 [Ceratopteris richardii]|uniref:Glutaredoxin domain-containing protein n=1 Tax=Ceratopteris richardii TaxID=49495 RepID=A0A8T2Q4K2_CERRI|nr:hypothetical protein KP509_38G044900 [Ceratopteris richardii]